MTLFSKLTSLAKNALGGQGSSQHNGGHGSTDWRAVVRNAADALTGDNRARDSRAGDPNRRGVTPSDRSGHESPGRRPNAAPSGGSGASLRSDQAAIARYDYLLRTADPQQIEQVHQEAFERLSPAQRAQIQERMRVELPANAQPRSSQVGDLARAATRAETAQPGFLRGLLARMDGRGSNSRRGPSMGGAVAGAGLAAGGMLAAVAGGAVLSSAAGPLLEQAANIGFDFDSLASGVDIETLSSGIDGLAADAGETVAGFGEQATGLRDHVTDIGSQLNIPGLGDLFGR